MARQGAKVLEKTCVERAGAHGVMLQVLSSAPEEPIGSDLPGTMVSANKTTLRVRFDSALVYNAPRFAGVMS